MLLFIAVLLPEVGWAQTEPTVTVGENTIQVDAVTGTRDEATGYNMFKFIAPKNGIFVLEYVTGASIYGAIWNGDKTKKYVTSTISISGNLSYGNVQKGETLYLGIRTFNGEAIEGEYSIKIYLIPSPEDVAIMGEGTTENPYLLYTAADLTWFRDYVNARLNRYASAKLMSNIDLVEYCHAENKDIAELSWIPISNNGNYYYHWKGNFDGNGKTISNLYVKDNNTHRGFFGYVSDATIKNLIFDNAIVDAGESAGILVGYAFDSTLENIKTMSGCVVKGWTGTGGIAGSLRGNISNCENHAVVSGTRSVGGICGSQNSGTMTFCINYGKVSSTNYYVGGLVGDGEGIENSANYGDVEGEYDAGSLVGWAEGKLKNVFCTGKVSN